METQQVISQYNGNNLYPRYQHYTNLRKGGVVWI